MKHYSSISAILILMLLFALKIDSVCADEFLEFKAALELYTKACKNLDAEAMAELEAEAIGFSQSGRMKPRDHSAFDKERRIAGFKKYRAKYEVYESIVTYDVIKVVDNTGIACGHFTDKRKPIGGELETIKGRQTVTFTKKDGQWKMVLYHRDIPINK